MKLPAEVARERLATASVVRLATVGADGRPHIVVATFAIEDDLIYTAVDSKPKGTRYLRRLRNIEANPHVSVLADRYEDDWNRLWWVRADGRATILRSPGDMDRPIRLLVARYRQYRQAAPEGPVISIAVDRWTGWAHREK